MGAMAGQGEGEGNVPGIGRGATLCYAAGGLGTGIVNSVPTLLLLYFTTEVMHIAAGIAAAILLVPKLWIIFWDPFVGSWADRSETRWGRRRPFMVVGAAILVTAFVLLFAPPDLGGGGTAAWIAAAYFLLMTGFSLYFVPYVTVPADIAAGPDARSRLVSWRMTFAMLGALASATMAPILVSAGGGGIAGYRLMAVIVAPVCLVAMLLPIMVLARRSFAEQDRPTASGQRLADQLRLAAADRRFRLLLAVQIIQVAAVGSASAATPYLIIQHLGRTSADIGLLFCLQLAPAAFAVPLFAALARRTGSIMAQAIAALIFAGGLMGVGALIHQRAAWDVIIAIVPIIGLGFGGMQGQAFVLSADLIHHAAHKGGQIGASYTGIWTASEKLGLAIGPAISAVMLALLRDDLVLWYMAGPAAMTILSLLLLRRVAFRG